MELLCSNSSFKSLQSKFHRFSYFLLLSSLINNCSLRKILVNNLFSSFCGIGIFLCIVSIHLTILWQDGRRPKTWGMTGEESNPASLFRLYVEYGRYTEATHLLLECMESFASMVIHVLVFISEVLLIT